MEINISGVGQKLWYNVKVSSCMHWASSRQRWWSNRLFINCKGWWILLARGWQCSNVIILSNLFRWRIIWYRAGIGRRQVFLKILIYCHNRWGNNFLVRMHSIVSNRHCWKRTCSISNSQIKSHQLSFYHQAMKMLYINFAANSEQLHIV